MQLARNSHVFAVLVMRKCIDIITAVWSTKYSVQSRDLSVKINRLLFRLTVRLSSFLKLKAEYHHERFYLHGVEYPSKLKKNKKKKQRMFVSLICAECSLSHSQSWQFSWPDAGETPRCRMTNGYVKSQVLLRNEISHKGFMYSRLWEKSILWWLF